jgi:hypothetical protein
MTKIKTDKRLLGTWKSDRRKTMAEWNWPKGYPTQKRKKVAAMFGKLTIRYTRTRIYSEFEDLRESDSYQVVAADSDSVAIVCWSSLLKENRIWHLHFEGDFFWIAIGPCREWFKRVKKPV